MFESIIVGLVVFVWLARKIFWALAELEKAREIEASREITEYRGPRWNAHGREIR